MTWKERRKGRKRPREDELGNRKDGAGWKKEKEEDRTAAFADASVEMGMTSG